MVINLTTYRNSSEVGNHLLSITGVMFELSSALYLDHLCASDVSQKHNLLYIYCT